MNKGGIELTKLKKSGNTYLYRGKKWRLNKPIKSYAKGKKMMVFATKIIDGKRKAKIIHFGALGYGHNYGVKAKKNYLTQSAGIMTKDGTLTKDDPWSANYWARKILWPKNMKPTGPRATKKTKA